jgi:hypothetical protein
MKKRLLVILLCISSYAFAQDKGYIALSGGGAIPLGKFANTDVNANDVGYAKAGGFFDLSFNYKLYKNFGISSILRAQFNGFNTKAVTDQNSGQNKSTSAQPWKTQSLMAGAYYALPLGKKFSFESRAMLGASNAILPQVDQSSTFLGNNYTSTTHSKSAIALSYLLGVGAKMNIRSKLCALFTVDYTSSNPNFKQVESSTTFNNMTQYTDVKLRISSLNIGLGIGFRL